MNFMMERITNYVINLDGTLHSKLADHIGKAIRIKTLEPYHVFYLEIRKTDLNFTSEYTEEEDVRIRMPFRTLVYVILGLQKFNIYNPDIKASGDGDFIFALSKAFETSNLWTTVKGMLGIMIPDFSTVEDFMKLVLGHEPEWVKRLENKFGSLPETNAQILKSLQSIEEYNEKKIFITKEIEKQVTRIKRSNYFLIIILLMFILHYVCENIFGISISVNNVLH